MKKTLFALFITIATVGALSADYGDCYYDKDGYRHCRDVVGVAVEEPLNVTGKTLEGIGGLFGGRRKKETQVIRESDGDKEYVTEYYE